MEPTSDPMMQPGVNDDPEGMSTSGELSPAMAKLSPAERWRGERPVPGGVQWELRYKDPKGTKTTTIRTVTADEREAKELGEWYVTTLGSPSVRYIGARLACAATTEQMLKAKGEAWPGLNVPAGPRRRG
jgi:hypothetical protein